MRNETDWTLRRALPTDAEFLYQVYASTRLEELAPLFWDAAQREAFLRMQFAAQQRHYQTHYADADFSIILKAEIPVGRLYVYRGAKEIRLLDIALLPEARGAGLGSSLVRDLLTEADAARKPVHLYVEQFNRAANLYVRFGFAPVEEHGVYIMMERLPLT